MSMRMGRGRWFIGAEGTRQDRVAVIGRQLAENLGTHVGESRRLETPTGPFQVRIIGISNSQNNEGLAVYSFLPLDPRASNTGDQFFDEPQPTAGGVRRSLPGADVQHLAAL